jgi:FixJ family two-component response regulator
MISGSLGDIEAVECLKSGATDYLLKDQLERLVPAIERALRESVVDRERVAAERALRDSEKKSACSSSIAPGCSIPAPPTIG